MTIDLDPLLDSIDILTTADGAHWPAHAHDDHELLSAISRSVTVVTPEAVYIAPRGTSVWIPAGVVHEVTAAPGNTMRCTWFEPDAGARLTGRVVVTSVPPLLDHVLAELGRYTDPARRARAEAFALDLLADSRETEVGLPTPGSGWLREVTDALIADPADRRTVDVWAAQSAVSVRTFSRQFAAETGMTFSHWRAELRLQLAMSMLANGTEVGRTARAVGFESLAAFSAAFRRRSGVSPRVFARTHGSMTDSRA
ncbi:AraC family transcriptional regulator [Microbacterium sp. MYb66]|jgi:AraC-like DNA-binding protein|uniref:helix-turn-helix domain-containing protein n=1 Tax=Microbacterium sp. MYb66 TaxID=1848692 RepID=UPI000CFE887B|nr:AraC family transcriptional regulator [Microbacterium sp. MYb66]PRA79389.1 AraC family transcriptional regulator [Microbacterium sp. MYb66]